MSGSPIWSAFSMSGLQRLHAWASGLTVPLAGIQTDCASQSLLTPASMSGSLLSLVEVRAMVKCRGTLLRPDPVTEPTTRVLKLGFRWQSVLHCHS